MINLCFTFTIWICFSAGIFYLHEFLYSFFLIDLLKYYSINHLILKRLSFFHPHLRRRKCLVFFIFCHMRTKNILLNAHLDMIKNHLILFLQANKYIFKIYHLCGGISIRVCISEILNTNI